MIRRTSPVPMPALAAHRHRRPLGSMLAASGVRRASPTYPITPQQRGTAQQVAQAGVPLSELAPNAPDSTPSSAATRCGTSPSSS